jgi:hypothetical protein
MLIKHSLQKAIVLSIVVFALIGCSAIHSTPNNIGKINLSNLLVTPSDMPSGWLYDGFTGPTADLRYLDAGTDSISRAFYSDLDANQSYPFAENVYRALGFLSNFHAQGNYNYLLGEMGVGSTPPDWKFQSQFADQSAISCAFPPTDSLMLCDWIARYKNVVIFVVAWLTPDRMTLNQLATVIGKIDAKAGKVILGK